jgi:hypothetical protein
MKKTFFLYKGILIVVLLTGFGSCISQYIPNETDTIVYKPNPEDKGYTIVIPKGYNSWGIGGGHGMGAYGFYYDNLTLKKTNDTTYNYIIYNEDAPYCDSVVFWGKEKGTYWKEYIIYCKGIKLIRVTLPVDDYDWRKDFDSTRHYVDEHGILYTKVPEMETISVGYRYVSRKNKALFDSCLLTLQLLQDTSIKIDSFKPEQEKRLEEIYRKLYLKWKATKKGRKRLKKMGINE